MSVMSITTDANKSLNAAAFWLLRWSSSSVAKSSGRAHRLRRVEQTEQVVGAQHAHNTTLPSQAHAHALQVAGFEQRVVFLVLQVGIPLCTMRHANGTMPRSMELTILVAASGKWSRWQLDGVAQFDRDLAPDATRWPDSTRWPRSRATETHHFVREEKKARTCGIALKHSMSTT